MTDKMNPQRPDRLPDRIMTGDQVLKMFYDQGIWHEDHIAYHLRKAGWRPEPDKTYKIWYHHTDPSDPADPGEDRLDYAELHPDAGMETLRKDIIGRIGKFNDNQLLKLARVFTNMFGALSTAGGIISGRK